MTARLCVMGAAAVVVVADVEELLVDASTAEALAIWHAIVLRIKMRATDVVKAVI